MYQILKKIAQTGIVSEPTPAPDETLRLLRERLEDSVLRWFAGALTVRHVDAGSCNGCELEIHAMNNPYHN
ncbi:MAG TPA: formate hydrogenlyase, partial [Burkholderiales bacterium]|nr:formate hydrogenlyase [Burkholderiales bacterium]